VLFTEPTFLFIYLPIVLALYFGAPRSVRGYVLTLASIVFYAVGEWAFLPWLVASTAASYYIAIGLDRWRGTRAARVLLVVGIALDLALLVVFKYAAFITTNVNELLGLAGLHALPVPSIALPLGISIFTFHKISDKIDIARNVAEVRRNPLELFLYIALFPQLVAAARPLDLTARDRRQGCCRRRARQADDLLRPHAAMDAAARVAITSRSTGRSIWLAERHRIRRPSPRNGRGAPCWDSALPPH
jgi:hypothetical protein